MSEVTAGVWWHYSTTDMLAISHHLWWTFRLSAAFWCS